MIHTQVVGGGGGGHGPMVGFGDDDDDDVGRCILKPMLEAPDFQRLCYFSCCTSHNVHR
jgi:hypothetical protein